MLSICDCVTLMYPATLGNSTGEGRLAIKRRLAEEEIQKINATTARMQADAVREWEQGIQ